MAIVLQVLVDIGPRPTVWLLATTAALALAITVGFLTSAANLLLLTGLVTLRIQGGPFSIATVCEGLNAIALMLLGPGAYSLDARLFGRRSFDLK
ncbi:hypothetical protein [Dyella subtropica]|uniref:hypothetical protein n=1 Tax=Dyella subtropica TaxID=2992127 RepID=UPI00224D50FF|nr:hypothetical protein [Dyella subtropica]